MFGGGVIARIVDKDMPIRAREIRGQLRSWWRLVARPGLSTDDARKTEWKIWGGISSGDDGERVDGGVVDLRITKPSGEVEPRPYVTFPPGIPQNDWRDTQYALFGAYDARNRSSSELLPQGLRFTLKLTVRDPSVQLQIEQAMRWWSAFGGLGGRTRRGAGAISVWSKNGHVLTAPTHAELASAGCRLLVGSSRDSALDAWRDAIAPLRNFRQGEHGRKGGRWRSYWPEPAAIRKITGTHRVKYVPEPPNFEYSFAPSPTDPEHFPRAVFGLPITFHFKNIKKDQADRHNNNPRNGGKKKMVADAKPDDPQDVELLAMKGGIEYKRLASPVIIKPLTLPDGKYAPCALFLPDSHVRAMGVTLTNSNGSAYSTLPKNFAAGTWFQEGVTRYPSAKSPGNEQAGFPLDAFREYLKGRGWAEP